MGISYTASLGYGFQIDSDLADECEDGEVEFPNSLSIIEHGSCYYNNEDSLLRFVVIKKSIHEVDLYDDPKEIEKLSIKKSWKEKLMDFAKKNNISEPKIGWIICLLEG